MWDETSTFKRGPGAKLPVFDNCRFSMTVPDQKKRKKKKKTRFPQGPSRLLGGFKGFVLTTIITDEQEKCFE